MTFPALRAAAAGNLGADNKGLLSSLAGFAGGPGLGIATTSLGAIQGLLSARKAADLQEKIKAAASPEHLDELYSTLRSHEGGRFASIRRATELRGQSAADKARASFRRAGLSGVGEAVANTADISSFLAGRRATEAFRSELLKRATTQQQQEVAALRGLLQTPQGTVSPTSSAIAGAGSGLEAFVNSAFANQLRGNDEED